MKKSKCLRMLAMLPILFVALTANAQDAIGVSDPKMSPCKGNGYYAPQTRTAAPEEGEWLDYSVVKREDGLYLHFIHENISWYCGLSEFNCTAKIEGSVITIDERPVDTEEDCMCFYDVSYDVGPLQEGDYTLIVTFYGHKHAEMKVHISEQLRGRFNVSDFVTIIENTTLKNVKESDVIYDLHGRRYAAFPFPGIFIQNGKKIVWTGK